jgi:hypothetical protein
MVKAVSIFLGGQFRPMEVIVLDQKQVPFEEFVTPIDYAAESAAAALRGETYSPGWVWEATLSDGRVFPVKDLSLLTGYNSRLGVKFRYGKRPEGYDAPVLSETGGGGSVPVPYFFRDGEITRKNLMVAVLQEMRNGHPVWNLPRAFLKPGEQHLKVAQTTAAEEFGLADPFKTEELGNPVNSNSAFLFNLPGEGVRFFRMEIDQRALRLEPENGHFLFKNEVEAVDVKNAATKRLLKSTFMPAYKIKRQLVGMEDMFTPAGICLLEDYLWPIE